MCYRARSTNYRKRPKGCWTSGCCIGDKFDLSMLWQPSRIRPSPRLPLTSGIPSPPGLIFPLTQNYILAEQPDTDAEVRYSFAHSGIQQGLYALIPKRKNQPFTGRSANACSSLPEDQREQHIFELVNHLNPASSNMQTNGTAAPDSRS